MQPQMKTILIAATMLAALASCESLRQEQPQPYQEVHLLSPTGMKWVVNDYQLRDFKAGEVVVVERWESGVWGIPNRPYPCPNCASVECVVTKVRPQPKPIR